MKCGILGLPNVGKSTLFNSLSDFRSQSANYPFCTIEPSLGSVMVPDDRLIVLNSIVNANRVVNAVVDIVDIAGLVKGASKGEGLGNKFLSNLSECNAIIHMIRCFKDDNIIHVENSVDPIRDKEIIDYEIQIRDLQLVEKAINKLIKIKNKDLVVKNDIDLLYIIKDNLNAGVNIRDIKLDNLENNCILDRLNLISHKPILYICNVDYDSILQGNEYSNNFLSYLNQKENVFSLLVCAKLEEDINNIDSYNDRIEFLNEFGLVEPITNRIIRMAYSMLGLHTYFTVGKKEIRAWTIKKGENIKNAAGVIHSDIQQRFIRAEVIKYNDYIKYKSEIKCRENGKIYSEGKNYIVEDGDIIHFLFGN